MSYSCCIAQPRTLPHPLSCSVATKLRPQSINPGFPMDVLIGMKPAGIKAAVLVYYECRELRCICKSPSYIKGTSEQLYSKSRTVRLHAAHPHEDVPAPKRAAQTPACPGPVERCPWSLPHSAVPTAASSWATMRQRSSTRIFTRCLSSPISPAPPRARSSGQAAGQPSIGVTPSSELWRGGKILNKLTGVAGGWMSSMMRSLGRLSWMMTIPLRMICWWKNYPCAALPSTSPTASCGWWSTGVRAAPRPAERTSDQPTDYGDNRECTSGHNLLYLDLYNIAQTPQLDSGGKREKPGSSLAHSSKASREEEWPVVANGCKEPPALQPELSPEPSNLSSLKKMPCGSSWLSSGSCPAKRKLMPAGEVVADSCSEDKSLFPPVRKKRALPCHPVPTACRSTDAKGAPFWNHLLPTAKGVIDLEVLGKKGYSIPKAETIQVTLFNPNKTVVKMFLVTYDFQDMLANHMTFLHCWFHSSKSGKIYLHDDIWLLFSHKSIEVDSGIPYELKSFTEMLRNPCYSPLT
ncbi:hypothetical protein llap_17500 [Limosa lapponica baueri]|uniref:Atos-like C-terminal domain-containing protein n=1 Tax=Limosa lapponica baueri TaxID=1758121 RepID=A0A2I0TEH8_LIMLA|nr:hypothetical protein llap_17500 [Limosa lapponica baueri]